MLNQGFTQRMVASDQVLVSPVESLEVWRRREQHPFAPGSCVAALTGKHEVPDSVQVDSRAQPGPLQHVREEVINVSQIGAPWLYAD